MDEKAEKTKLPIKDKLDFLSKVYDRMVGLTANADTKAGIILAIHSFWAISYGPNLSKLIISFPLKSIKMILWLLSFLLIIAFFIAFIRSGYKAAMIFSPRLRPLAGESPRRLSLIYFADIIKMPGETIHDKSHAYHQQLDDTSYEDIIEDLTIRISDIASVVHEKYSCAEEAVKRSIYTFLLWVISLMFLMIMNLA